MQLVGVFRVRLSRRQPFSSIQTHRNLAKRTQETYLALKQPPLHPPAQIFGPVWTVLYASMGYAAYRAWTVGTSSFDPRKVSLAKVRSCEKQEVTMLIDAS